MITTNLSTRPFYNERLVHTVLAVVTVLILAVSALNAWAIVALSGKEAQQNARAARAETQTDRARQAAQRVRRSIDAAELETITTAASEANRLIDERTFSWTRLLSDFEKLLPADVRITSVSPHADRDGGMTIDLGVVARRAEDVNEFVERLESEGGFADVVPRQENVNEQGLRDLVLGGRYTGVARRAAQGQR